jgi:hypothetical protein
LDKDRFRRNLEEAAESTIEFARNQVTNTLSSDYKFIIVPDGDETRGGLTDEENKRLLARIEEKGTIFTTEEALERLWSRERVPVFIDIAVHESRKDVTLIQLLTDGRLRKEDKDIYYPEGPIPPFHICLRLPPYQDFDTKEKFDVNWHKKPLLIKWKLWLAKMRFKRKM